MIITSTEAQNNFGKYLRECKNGPIMITKNGEFVAKLTDSNYSEEISTYSHVAESNSAYLYKTGTMTYEEFMVMNENAKERYEFIDGIVYLMASPRVKHQRAVGALFSKLSSFFDDKPCQPFFSPFDVTLYRRENKEVVRGVVQPDLLIACDIDENTNENDFYTGTPTLVIEVLSPSSRSKDHITKLDLYKESGIKEYWIVDPVIKEVLVFEFIEFELGRLATFHQGEEIKSFYYEELAFVLEQK